jgi:hypothetical protein
MIWQVYDNESCMMVVSSESQTDVGKKTIAINSFVFILFLFFLAVQVVGVKQ